MSSATTPGLRWNRRRVAVFAAVVAGVLLVLVALVAAFLQRDTALPGTRLDGRDVGGLNRTELLAVSEEVAADRRARVVTVQADDRSEDVSAKAVGVRVDPEATADAALDDRHGGVTGLMHGLAAMFGMAHDVHPVAALRERRLAAEVERLQGELGDPVNHGGFAAEISGETVDLTVVEPQAGRTFDADALDQRLRDELLTGRDGELEIDVDVDEPQADVAAARAVTARAEALLEKPLVLTGSAGDGDADRELTLPPRVLGPILRAEPDGDGGLRLTTDETLLRAAVEEAAEPLTEEPRPAALRTSAPGVLLTAQYDATFEPRRISTSIRAGKPGYRVDVDATVATVTAAVGEERRTGELPGEVIPVPADEDDLAGVDQVIGSFTTYYPCCAPRVTNIQRMAEIVDGTVVAPGTTFSLNGVVGERTAEGGFVEDSAIVDGKLEKQFGGGVSQFSTTMLNAVWFAGLARLESQPHSIYISRYPPGREATLDYTSIDNVWRNDTDFPVVVRATAGAGSVTVALYGHTGKRSVFSDTGEREMREDGGFRIVVDRTVTDAGTITKQDSLTWTYRAPLETEDEKKKKKKKADAEAAAETGDATPTASASATAG
jgi:hypothetical protein